MTDLPHRITRRRGTPDVRFECPSCRAGLVAPITDAGQPDQCPECGAGFTTPGVAERERWEAETEAKRRADADRWQQEREAWMRDQNARWKAAVEAAAAPSAPPGPAGGIDTDALIRRDQAKKAAQAAPSVPAAESPAAALENVKFRSDRAFWWAFAGFGLGVLGALLVLGGSGAGMVLVFLASAVFSLAFPYYLVMRAALAIVRYLHAWRTESMIARPAQPTQPDATPSTVNTLTPQGEKPII